MPESNLPTDLQTLWDELNQSDSARRQRLQRQRFAQRAKQFASEQATETQYTDDEVYKTLVFRLGDERYAMTVDAITSVHPMLAVTRVPSIPAYYRGVVNLRGQIVSVLDLGRFLNVPTDAPFDTRELIFIKQDNMTLALLVDHIEGVEIMPKDSVQTIDLRYSLGVTVQEIVLIDLDYLLDDDRLTIRGK